MTNNQRAIIIGNGGHAKVLKEILELNSIDLAGVIDNDQSCKDPLYIGNDDNFLDIASQYQDCLLVNGIGSIRRPELRKKIFIRYKNLGFSFLTLMHPSAIISPNATIGEGAQIMAGCVIQTGCTIGQNVIINTASTLDHDCTVGRHTHIAPGCVFSGNVHLGEACHIGPSSIFIQSLRVGDNVFVSAGSVVIKNVTANATVKHKPKE